ncbi:cytochrome B [Bordetella genomosp. 8]|uniref:Cytochrome B n=1 Tax=Bordetella genomosp. 8 TaxID=1416806 RepID=A0A1W6YL32_9BORD|nr:cytochrome b/b6 domain-containing protein [Bordetella genomosp. 8]ARP81790.1 cytochrome B [Bordetella genomosp. 8]
MNTTASPADLPKQADRPVQPGWLRVTHWINVLAVIVMVMSGWRIYNASPIFDFSFPDGYTLGGWLGGALQWHFAFMWLLFANGVFYLVMNIATGRMARRFFPLSPRGVVQDLFAALRGRLSHADPRHYNHVQRVAYLLIVLDLVMLVLSGLSIWKPVQFGPLRALLGGYDTARVIHFVAMALLVAFVLLHVVMVALVPRTLRTMITGR